MIAGTLLDRAMKQGDLAIERGHEPAPETSPRVRRLQGIVNTFGVLNIGFQATVMATTSVLAWR